NGDIISEGQRHSRMCQLAGSLRRQGLSEVAILANLQVVNQQHCKPPLDDADVNRISKDIGRKPANIRSQRMPETSANVEIESFANVPIEEIHWLWADRIASGKLNLFVGDPEKGKSLVSIDVAARGSTGRDFADGSSTEQGDVLIVSCDDDASDTVAPRLLAAGANLELVHRIKGVTVSLPDGQTGQSFFNLERDLERLEQALDRFPNIK